MGTRRMAGVYACLVSARRGLALLQQRGGVAARPRARGLAARSLRLRSTTEATTEAPAVGTELPTKYDFGLFEEELYKWWEKEGYFQPAAGDHPRGAFTIPMPPPNVTGRLHLGHAMFVALQDILTRFHRMRGRPTLWLPGTDHAGIATQLLVERQLAAEGTSRVEMGREKFLERVYEYKDVNGGAIMSQMRRLGASADWTREKFTLDADMSAAVNEAFVTLHDRGLVYRGARMVNWSPNLGTAVSDLEVEFEERIGKLYYFKYPIADSDDFLTVATTRPETILGDAAVCVHPDDERYQKYIGKECVVPLQGRRVPIVADTYVDMAFGSGVLKVTPGHDHNDYAIGQRQKLPIINILNADATVNANGGAYEGLERFACRDKLWKDMEAAGLTIKVDSKHEQRVPISQRGGEVIEPLVSTQWFVNTNNMAAKAVDAVRSGAVQIVPARFEKDWYNWLEKPQDWCVSRQLWWGHQIPVWYVDGHEGYFVARNEADARAQATTVLGSDPGEKLVRDPDVLDTWFSSGLWPFATVGWPNAAEAGSDLARFYPASCLETGYDILFFWVARMVMMGVEFTGKAPFETIYMHGLVRDATGAKMSKTKGNVIDPLDVVAEYGADALRYTLVTGVTPGQDVPLSMERVEQNRNFANKLWNAARFVDTRAPRGAADLHFPLGAEELASLPMPERWIVSKAHETAKGVTASLEAYAIGDAGRQIYEFIWDEFADWYIELSKTRQDGKRREQSDRVLRYVLDVSLRLLHPYMPHVTEFLWQRLFASQGGALIVAQWPALEFGQPELAVDADALKAFDQVKAVCRALRNIRAEYDVEPKFKIAAKIVSANDKLAGELQGEVALLAFLGKSDVARLEVSHSAEGFAADDYVRLVVAEGLDVYVPVADLQKDPKKEVDRLERQVAKLDKEVAGLQGRLGNPGFADKAPKELVDATTAQLNDKLEQTRALRDSIAVLQAKC
ncbi:tRNA synthetases class I-domain-containing protein [Pelagophyceae sp. CCMP2097]|nr:tRNA synthetases class I-domain-containing protein [Pelagophyceae sp. CCMP2097]